MADPHYMNKSSHYKCLVFRDYVYDYLIKNKLADYKTLKFKFNHVNYKAKANDFTVRAQLTRLVRDLRVAQVPGSKPRIFHLPHKKPTVLELLEYQKPQVYALFTHMEKKLSVRTKYLPVRFGKKLWQLEEKIRVLKRLGLVEKLRKEWVRVTEKGHELMKAKIEEEAFKKLLE